MEQPKNVHQSDQSRPVYRRVDDYQSDQSAPPKGGQPETGRPGIRGLTSLETGRASRYARCPVCHQIRIHALTSDRCECAACGSMIPNDALLAAKDRELQAKRSALGIGGSR